MLKGEPKPSEVTKTSEGRHYHIDLASGNLADYILLCVDQARRGACSTLFTLGSLAGLRTGAVCTAYANRARGEWIGDTERAAADDAAERVGSEAVRLLATIDAWKAKHQKPHFVPQLPAY